MVQCIATPDFERDLKKLFKKYPAIKKDVLQLQNDLLQEPTKGTLIGENTYKIRLAISGKNKGKRGGARVITFVDVIVNFENVTDDKDNSLTKIYLLTIYDKAEIASVPDNEILAMIQRIKKQKSEQI